MLLRNDLTEKNHFSWIAALLEAQKLPKWIVKVCTTNEVSSGLVWARFPHKILKESSNRSEIFRAVGKKVNKKVNNEEIGLFRALNERGEALVALFKPNEKPKLSLSVNLFFVFFVLKVSIGARLARHRCIFCSKGEWSFTVGKLPLTATIYLVSRVALVTPSTLLVTEFT